MALLTSKPGARHIIKQSQTKKLPRALFDIWEFANLINFKGGTDNFVPLHFEMTRDLEYMVTPEYQQKVRDYKLLEIPTTFIACVSRGHLKSTIRTVLYVMWRVYRNPNIRICIGTNVESLSTSLIRELRSYFENETLQATVWNNRPHIKGDLIPKLNTSRKKASKLDDLNYIDDYQTDTNDRKIIWNNRALQVNRNGIFKEPTVDTTCVGAINTGNHYDLVIFDDVVDFRNSDTLNKQEKLQRWCYDIESQLDPIRIEPVCDGLDDTVGNIKVINGTRYYDGDYNNQTIEASVGNVDEGIEPDATISVFERNIYVNGVDESDGFSWEPRFNSQVIAMLRRRMDRKTFSSQYLNTTASVFGMGENDFNFHRVDDSRLSTLAGTVKYYDDLGNIYDVNLRAICDIGIKNDFSVCIIGFYLNKDTFVVFEVIHNQGSLSVFLEELYEKVMLYNVSYCGIEANGVGAGVCTSLKLIHDRNRNTTRFPFYDFYSTDAKSNRIAYAMTFMKESRVVLSPRVASNSLFVRYVKAYPYAEHDDFIDCLGIALQRIPRKEPRLVGDTRVVGSYMNNTEKFLIDLKSVKEINGQGIRGMLGTCS